MGMTPVGCHSNSVIWGSKLLCAVLIQPHHVDRKWHLLLLYDDNAADQGHTQEAHSLGYRLWGSAATGWLMLNPSLPVSLGLRWPEQYYKLWSLTGSHQRWAYTRVALGLLLRLAWTGSEDSSGLVWVAWRSPLWQMVMDGQSRLWLLQTLSSDGGPVGPVGPVGHDKERGGGGASRTSHPQLFIWTTLGLLTFQPLIELCRRWIH